MSRRAKAPLSVRFLLKCSSVAWTSWFPSVWFRFSRYGQPGQGPKDSVLPPKTIKKIDKNKNNQVRIIRIMTCILDQNRDSWNEAMIKWNLLVKREQTLIFDLVLFCIWTLSWKSSRRLRRELHRSLLQLPEGRKTNKEGNIFIHFWLHLKLCN